MNIQEAIQYGQDALTASSDSARLDAELLVCHTLQCKRTFLYAHSKDVLSLVQETAYKEWVELRKDSIPMAYILGTKEFWSLNLKLSTKTLIPRPATESIVEHILQIELPHNAAILDLGTGSGAIALSLAKEHPQWQIIATDIQANALAIAQKNAQNYGFNNIQFLWSHWFAKLAQKTFDLIVSNPPYIDAKDPHLFRGDVQYEPQRSLISANQGYADLVFLIQKSKKYLKKNGILILEHGYQQQEKLMTLLTDEGFNNIQGFVDHEGLNRFCQGVYLG
jgi:release factor glutamine methyltransferase